MLTLRRVARLRAELLLLVGASVVVAMVVASQFLAADTFERYRLLVGAVSDVKQAVTETHIYLEERLSGDEGIDATRLVEVRLTDTEADCRLILDGGIGATGPVRALDDPATRARVAALCLRVVDLHAAATARLVAVDGSASGSELDVVFDAIFDDVLRLSDESQAAMSRAVDAEMGEFRIINGGVVVVVSVLLVGLGILIRRYRLSTERTRLTHAQAGVEAQGVLAEAQREAKRGDVLNRLADRVTFANGESDLVDAATAAFRRLLPSDAGDVLLLNSSQDRLMVAAAWGDQDHELGRPAKIDTPSLCPGIRRGSVYALDDGTDDLAVACAAHPIDSGSALCVPMLALGKSVGVIHLVRTGTNAFDAPSQQLAARVAEQVALGLANARLIQTMERLAMADPLTGLHNARFFDPLLDRELASSRRDGTDLAVAMIDIDHFKRFNDTHGHPGGDEALKAFSRAIKSAVRESDTVARYGGEEFVVLMRKTDLAGAIVAAEKIRAAIEQTIVDIGPNRTARVTASFGVASTSAHGADRMLLMQIADEALYRAKEAGRNRVVAADGAFVPPESGVPAEPPAPRPLRKVAGRRA